MEEVFLRVGQSAAAHEEKSEPVDGSAEASLGQDMGGKRSSPVCQRMCVDTRMSC